MAVDESRHQVKLSLPSAFARRAKQAAEGECRSLPKQIEYWARIGERYEHSRTRLRPTSTTTDPYDDLETLAAQHTDWAVPVVERQRAAGIPVWGLDEDGNLVPS